MFNHEQEITIGAHLHAGSRQLMGATRTITGMVQKSADNQPFIRATVAATGTDGAWGLQGAVPGFTISTATGAIGTDPKIRSRGLTGSVHRRLAGANPLILVDNQEMQSLQVINPRDIASIPVLKGAVSTSIYDTRAALGVILITTKSGNKNTPARISYSDNFAWSTPITAPKLISGADIMRKPRFRLYNVRIPIRQVLKTSGCS
jgi:TonB-dependent SusC/RagA subfamily outer membrane receptor